MEFEQAQQAAASVEGWLSPAEARALYDLARSCSGRGVIVEIGSWQGKSTIYLAAGSRAGAGARIIAIDPHTGSPEHHRELGEVSTLDAFTRNLAQAGLSDLVEPMVMTSANAAEQVDEPVELVFIDGAHEPEMVRLDFNLWVPRLLEGGWVALHDTIAWPGPRRIAIDDVLRAKDFRRAGFADSLVFGQKVVRASLTERFANHRALAAKLVYERGRELKLPKPLLKLGKRLIQRARR